MEDMLLLEFFKEIDNKQMFDIFIMRKKTMEIVSGVTLVDMQTRTPCLTKLYTSYLWRCRGHASSIVLRAKELCGGKNALTTLVTDDQNIEFYNSLGFVLSYDYPNPDKDIIMSLLLK